MPLVISCKDKLIKGHTHDTGVLGLSPLVRMSSGILITNENHKKTHTGVLRERYKLYYSIKKQSNQKEH